ncbi:MAG: DoxX family protein [Geminicoccaceae bacterium]
MFRLIGSLHDKVFGGIQRGFENWFLGLLARLVFAAVLFMYFFNSALKKIGDGPLGFLEISSGAYAQIMPSIAEAYNYDATQIPLIPYKLIAYAGTYAEFVLPILIIIGLFTRIAAIGMIVFVLVQSYVDIAFHNVGESTIGAWFDNISNSAILDQRALWVFLFVYLVVRGAGAISLDYLFNGRKAASYSSRYSRVMA